MDSTMKGLNPDWNSTLNGLNSSQPCRVQFLLQPSFIQKTIYKTKKTDFKKKKHHSNLKRSPSKNKILMFSLYMNEGKNQPRIGLNHLVLSLFYVESHSEFSPLGVESIWGQSIWG
jgi:hypothetical protein